MAHGYKNPPVLTAESVYESWKVELEIWMAMTEIVQERQALAVTLGSLSGQAKARALEIDVAALKDKTGLQTLLKALDELYLQDSIDSAYSAYQDFDVFVKTDNMTMAEFIIEYERRYTRCKKYEMQMPDAVLSFKLLDSSRLGQREKQLVLTAAHDRKFNSMKSALKRIFGNSKEKEELESGITVKREEAAYFTRNQKQYGQRPPSSRNNFSSKNNTSRPELGTNPMNKFGKRSKCAICQSTFHWVKDCPHKDKEEVNITETDEQCNVTLFTKQNNENEIFMTEAMGCAVIDTACTSTVCGTKWLEKYLQSLNEEERSSVTTKESNKSFRFGDGVKVKSTSCVAIPAVIGETQCVIHTEVVESEIPLLLGKPSLKRAGTVLDLPNDKATMFQKPVILDLTSTGHYCIDLRKKNMNGTDEKTTSEILVTDEELENKILATDELENKALVSDEMVNKELEEEALFLKNNMNGSDRRKILIKLHKQFGHATAERLRRLLQNAGTTDLGIFRELETIVEECETCNKYRKQPPKPAVGLPKATDFNETVAVDLHQLEKNLWYLHIIDEFTRFSAGAILTSKRSADFVQKFIKHWISIHGAPRKLLSDNGGEFNNAEVRDMCENFDIEVKTTAAYSPWSNGLLERHNQTLTTIMKKVKSERNCDWETALRWGLMAKNSLSNISGYSAYQLVFGRNPNLPSVLTNKPPSLEGSTTSNVVGKHLNVMHATRQAFVEAESSERLRRALRKQIRPSGGNFETGDKVYFKRSDNPEWKGPGCVIGQDGTVVFVRQGGMVVRVHRSRIRKCTDKVDTGNGQSTNMEDEEVGDRDRLIDGPDSDAENQENRETENREENAELEEDLEQRTNVSQIRSGQYISYTHQETGNDILAKVINRAGKATGKNRHWFNLEYTQQDLQGIKQSVDLSQVDNLKITGPQLAEEEMFLLEDISWIEPKQAELENWRRNDVFREIDDEGQRCISTRWVCTLKGTPEQIVPKARLVARGFEEKGNDEIPKDSPTCTKESLKLILSIFCQKDWKPHSMDIKTAFLQGEKLEREVFIKPPKEAKAEGKIWQLKKCVYGLGDASLHWYHKVKAVMLELGAIISRLDPAVFYWLDEEGSTSGILACHVDDFIWGGNKRFASEVITDIRLRFKVGKEESRAFLYLGMQLEHNDHKIWIHQKKYGESISLAHIEKGRSMDKQTPLNDLEKQTLRSKVGQVMWIAKQTRPDVLFDACKLATSVKDARIEHLQTANKIIKKVKSEKVNLKFQDVGEEPFLVVFSDASLGNLPDGGTQGGHVILLSGRDGQISPVCWNSKKIRRVVRSTLAGETLAMADGIDTGIFLSTLYGELNRTTDLPLVCITDCRSLHDAIYSTKAVTEKRLRMEIAGIKELVERGQIKEVQWVRTEKQLADCLTKEGASSVKLLKALEEGKF